MEGDVDVTSLHILHFKAFHNYLLPTIAEDINELELTTQDFISEMVIFVNALELNNTPPLAVFKLVF